MPIFAYYMRIDHRGPQIRVTKQILDCTYIVTFFEQMSGKTVP